MAMMFGRAIELADPIQKRAVRHASSCLYIVPSRHIQSPADLLIEMRGNALDFLDGKRLCRTVCVDVGAGG
jgi:hypothetical protein